MNLHGAKTEMGGIVPRSLCNAPALLPRAGRQRLSTRNWRAAGSVTQDSDGDSRSWSGNWQPGSAKPFHWLARTGRTPRRLIGSFPMVGWMSSRFWPGTFRPPVSASAATDGPILVLHDTTEFSYTRSPRKRSASFINRVAGRTKEGRPRLHTLCGILMHSSLAVTVEGLPLGLAAIKFWTRSKFKGTNALKRKVNPTRVPIEAKESVRWLENLRQSTDLLGEPARCIHIGDRESDIYELFCAAQQSGTNFLVRTCVDRLAGDGQHTIAGLMRRIKVKTTHQVEVRDAKGTVRKRP